MADLERFCLLCFTVFARCGFITKLCRVAIATCETVKLFPPVGLGGLFFTEHFNTTISSLFHNTSARVAVQFVRPLICCAETRKPRISEASLILIT